MVIKMFSFRFNSVIFSILLIFFHRNLNEVINVYITVNLVMPSIVYLLILILLLYLMLQRLSPTMLRIISLI